MPTISPPPSDSPQQARRERVPVYVCPKCGAIGDVKWKRAYTAADLAEHKARQAEMRAASDRFWFPDYERLWAIQDGIQHGEHLACSCPRCSHYWIEPVLTAVGPTPIHDALVVERGE